MAGLTVPIYEQRVGITPEANVRPIPMDTGQQESQGIQQAGTALGNLGLAIGQLDRYRRMQDARIKNIQTTGALYGSLSDLGSKFSQDPDISTAPQRFETAADGVFAKATADITDPTLKAEVGAEYQRMKVAQGLQLRNVLQTRRIDESRAALDVATDGYVHQAATATNDAEYAAARTAALNSIDGAAAVGIITAQDAVKRKQQFETQRDTLRVEQLGQSNPAAMVAQLADPNFMPDMNPDKRQALSQHMATLANSQMTRALAAETRAQRLQDHAQKLLEDSTSKAGDDLFAKGQLTPDWIEANKASLSPADYRHFWTQATNPPPVHTDPATYATLLDRATSTTDPGTLDAVKEDARGALLGGKIKTEDYSQISRLAESRGPQTPNWQKQGEDYIRSGLAPSPLIFDAAQHQRLGSALLDFNNWAAAHPQATSADAQREMKNIVSGYAIVDWNQKLSVLRTPDHLIGDRNNPNIDETVNATNDYYLNLHHGDIAAMSTDWDYRAQISLLNQWRDALARKAAAEAQ